MRILLVEDHADTRYVFERYFNRRGHVVTSAGDVETASRFLRDQTFDVIISDIALPDGTGYALMNEARRNGVGALGIAISAYGFPNDAFEGKVTGFNYHVPKPFDCAFLDSLINEAKHEGVAGSH
jgi:CheY-like chemotaxis protein